jgi:hypothetical protein
LRQFERLFDVRILDTLVATRQQYDEFLASTREIHAIAGTLIDSQLRYTTTGRFDIAGIAELQAANSHINSRARVGSQRALNYRT